MAHFAVHIRSERTNVGLDNDPRPNVVVFTVVSVRAPSAKKAEQKIRDNDDGYSNVSLKTFVEPWPLPLGAPTGSVIRNHFA